MNVIRASLSTISIALVLGCANCNSKPAEDTPEPAAAAVGPTIQIVVSASDYDATGVEKVFTVPVERTLKRGKNVEHIWSSSTSERAELEVTFKAGISEEEALEQASLTAEKIAMRSQGAFGTPEVTVDTDDEPLRIRLSGTDIDAMHRVGQAVAEEARQLDGVTSATPSMDMVPDVAVSIDNEKLAAHGLKMMAVTAQLSKPEIQNGTDIDTIMAVPIESRDGTVVPLGDIADVQLTRTPTRLDLVDGNRVAWVSVDAAAGDDTLRVALQGITSPDPSIRVSVED